MASWTPFKAYETAVTCCIQATQEFVSARQACCTESSAGIFTHGPSRYTLENSWRKKVESYESIMRKACSLLMVEAARTHTTSARIGAISTNDDPPSYEHATDAPNDTASGLASDVRVLKDREREWRSYWRKSTEARLTITGQSAGVTQDNYSMMHCTLSRTVVDMDKEMMQVSAYLQDVEYGARRFLHDLDQTGVLQEGNRRKVKTSSDEEITSDRETQLTALNGKDGSITLPEQHQLEQDSSARIVILETVKRGINSWISRPFPWARRNDGHRGRQDSVATTADSNRSRRQAGEAELYIDTPPPFGPFQIYAMYSYGREHGKRLRKGDLSFTAGQVIDVVGVIDILWLSGEYTDRFGKSHSGTLPREYTIPWHPEIHNRWRLSSSDESAKSYYQAYQRLVSLSDWLHLEQQNYDLNEGRGLKAHRLSLHSIPALVERMDVLKAILHETYRPRRDLDVEVEEMTERMENLRTKAAERMMEYQAFVDADLFR